MRTHRGIGWALGLAVGLAFVGGWSSPTLAADHDGETSREPAVVTVDDPIENQYLVVLEREPGTISAAGARAAIGDVLDDVEDPVKLLHSYRSAVVGFAARMSPEDAARLAADERVALVEEDGVVHPTATEPASTWGLDRIDEPDLPLDGSFRVDQRGAGVRAYIIDSGIRTSHAQFGGRASVGVDLVGDGRAGQDCHGHGTHVAGTLGGVTHGVANGVDLVAVRIFGCSGGSPVSRTVAAVDWVTANAARPAVVNMSLGGDHSEALDAALRASIGSGLVYAVSAGNDSDDACGHSPASTAAAITVAASDADDATASFSNLGSCVDLFAPGVEVVSAWFTSDTASRTISGTSMSTPHVAGVSATILEAMPHATPAAVTEELTDRAVRDRITDLHGNEAPNLLLQTVHRQAPSLSVVLDARPGTSPAFRFDGCWVGVGCAPFELDEDRATSSPRSITYSGLVPADYRIQLAHRSGWDLSDLRCSPGGEVAIDLQTQRAEVSLSGQSHVICTFAVVARSSLGLTADAIPNDPVDFTYDVCRVTEGSGQCEAMGAPVVLDDDADTVRARTAILDGLLPGAYRITQHALDQWGLVDIDCDGAPLVELGQRRVTVTLVSGDSINCTFTTSVTSISVSALVQGGDDPQDFVFEGCWVGVGCSQFALDDDPSDATLPLQRVFSPLSPGRYTIRLQPTPGWHVAVLGCSSGVVVDPAAGLATLELPLGQRANCTYVMRPTQVTVVLDAGSTGEAFTFTGCRVADTACGPFVLDADPATSAPSQLPFGVLVPGAYTIDVAVPAGWRLEGVSCPDASTTARPTGVGVQIPSGAQLICTFRLRPTTGFVEPI